MTDEEFWNRIENCDHHLVPVEHDGKWYIQCEHCRAYVAPPLAETN